jgi:hypothetical protein
VRLLGAGVDLQFPDLRAPELVAGQHPLHGLPQDLGRPALELLAERPAAQATGVARVAAVHLLVELVAGDVDLLRVDDDDEVARVDMGRVGRLVLAAQGIGDAGGQTAERLPLGIDEVPAASDLARLCVPGLLHAQKVGAQECAGAEW